MTETAPFFATLADGPSGGRAFWLMTDDGVRIRIGLWPGGSKGTVVFLPGRTEYIEKYGRTARELMARGWSVISLDWRGQGLSGRFLPDPMLGHVQQFSDYQRDLDALMEFVATEGEGQGLTGPLMLMSHSMGGLAGLQALNRGLPFRAAVFSAPMWGIRIPLWRLPLAGMMRRLPMALPQDQNYAPTARAKSYLLRTGFAANHLTGCEETYSWLKGHLEAEPQLQLGGPSLGWLRSALRGCAMALQGPAPDVPAVIALGSEEHIVRAAPIRRRIRDWKNCRLDLYEGARHEVPMERAPHRERFFDSADQLFSTWASRKLAG